MTFFLNMADIYIQPKGIKIQPDVIINLEMYIIPSLNLGYDRNPVTRRRKDSINKRVWGTLILRVCEKFLAKAHINAWI